MKIWLNASTLLHTLDYIFEQEVVTMMTFFLSLIFSLSTVVFADVRVIDSASDKIVSVLDPHVIKFVHVDSLLVPFNYPGQSTNWLPNSKKSLAVLTDENSAKVVCEANAFDAQEQQDDSCLRKMNAILQEAIEQGVFVVAMPASGRLYTFAISGQRLKFPKIDAELGSRGSEP